MKWISVKDSLPEIPEGKYGISVLVAEYDPIYEECCPGRGYDVNNCLYALVDYDKMPMFKGSIFADGTPAFMTIFYGKESTWGPVCDEVTHWMYLPEPPEYKF